MQIYTHEKEAGLSDKILSTLSLNYFIPLESATQQTIEEFLGQTKATDTPISFANSRIGYPIKTILASVGWNKNDDVFDKAQMWRARYTPIDTPINKEHNAKEIIGHIKSVSAIDFEGNNLNLDWDESQIPELYHLITSGILYTNYFHDMADREKMYELIAEIRDGKWFVSMEVLFQDFDYAIIKPDGEKGVIARKEETSWLTKCLRIYGGSGEHEGYKVGRLLKEMCFSGKGVVKQPANTPSIFLFPNDTLHGEWKNCANLIDLGYNNSMTNISGDSNMADDIKALEKELAELKAEKNAKAAVEATHKEEVKTLQAKIDELTKANEKLAADNSAAIAEANKLAQESIANKEQEIKTLNTTKATLEAEIEKYKAEADKAKAEKAKSDRVSTLIKAGAPEDKAIELVEKYAGFSDEQFNTDIVELVAAKFPPKDDKKEDMKKEEKKSKSKTIAEIFSDSNIEEKVDAPLAIANEIDTDLAEFSKCLASLMPKTEKIINKNEGK